MALTTPRTMPGTLELLPREQIAFQSMLDTIRRGFEVYGFVPIETPAIEFADILLTKGGGETERQVYFVQSTGALERGSEQPVRPEHALRFDLTVPLARYVAEHERELAFPFRRYQMQRVYRGERAQRGRFREFYQCDIDVIGKDSLSIRYDAEIPAVIHAVFSALDIGAFTIQLNNRKLMRGFFEGLGIGDGERQMLVLREVDKLDKRGPDHVRGVLTGGEFGLSTAAADSIMRFVEVRSTSLADAHAKLAALGSGTETFEQGRAELREVLDTVAAFGVPESAFALNLSIARGLDYYTGTVYETTLNDHPDIGSICSGGRYDNLAANYTKSQLPGVGISIGLTRLFWQLREAGLLEASDSSVQVLVTLMDAAHLPDCLAIAQALREAGIASEIALEGGKLGKQLKYADRSGIRFAVVAGTDELARAAVAVKDLRRGEQFEVPRTRLVEALRAKLSQDEVRKA
ncbi:MAG TPA: histidine--tRNA ligase [Rhodanobacteraceae bacterium]|nr:histidine--tRNA ligase [Rhodanobacteraceae bacterium]